MSTTQTSQETAVILSPLAAKEIGRIISEQELDPAKVRLRVGLKAAVAPASPTSST